MGVGIAPCVLTSAGELGASGTEAKEWTGWSPEISFSPIQPMRCRPWRRMVRTMRHATRISRRSRHRSVAAILLTGVVAFSTHLVSAQKKGVGLWGNTDVVGPIAEMKLEWYYDWGTGVYFTTPAAFVPMIWGAADVTDQNLTRAKSAGQILLGFNEPDGSDGSQSNVTVAKALEFWPRLVETGMRLGSPAPASDPSPSGSWLEKFMQGAQDKNLRVDFICLHWYGRRFETQQALGDLHQFLVDAHRKFNRPIWLTEYALIAWGGNPMFPSLDEQAAFARVSAQMLDTMAFVERYAWFSLHRYGQSGAGATENSFLYDGAVATPVGRAYGSATTSTVSPLCPVDGYSFLLGGSRYALPAPEPRARIRDLCGRRIRDMDIRSGISGEWTGGDGSEVGNRVGRNGAPGFDILEVEQDHGIGTMFPVKKR